MMDRTEQAVFAFAGLLAAVMIAYMLYCLGRGIYLEANAPRVTGTVTTIGACDRYGRCGALLDNGHKCRLAYPVVGQFAECRR